MKEYYDEIHKSLDWWLFIKDKIKVFRDCIRVLALDLACKTDTYSPDKFQEREKEIGQIYNDYVDDTYVEFEKFMQLKELITKMLLKVMEEKSFDDHLGNIYMRFVPPSKTKGTGQFFTPYNVSKMMASLNCPPIREEVILCVNDPACGAGGLLVAMCEILHEQGINYTQQVLFVANDIDKMCVDMTYLQLSFLGASAIVEHRDTLTQECWDVYRTPGFVLSPSVQRKYKQITNKNESEM